MFARQIQGVAKKVSIKDFVVFSQQRVSISLLDHSRSRLLALFENNEEDVQQHVPKFLYDADKDFYVGALKLQVLENASMEK